MRLLAPVLLLAATGAAAQTQAEMNRDADAAFARADGAMNRQWGTTLGQMKRRDAAVKWRAGAFSHANALLASQRAWLRFRDTQCIAESGEFAGGSAQGMAATRCKARLTEERTAQLRGLEWRR